MVESNNKKKEVYIASSAIDDSMISKEFHSSIMMNKNTDNAQIPSYYDDKFKQQLDYLNSHINPGTGYLLILTDKLNYYPGDTIHGCILFELFDSSFSKDLIIFITVF